MACIRVFARHSLGIYSPEVQSDCVGDHNRLRGIAVRIPFHLYFTLLIDMIGSINCFSVSVGTEVMNLKYDSRKRQKELWNIPYPQQGSKQSDWDRIAYYAQSQSKSRSSLHVTNLNCNQSYQSGCKWFTCRKLLLSLNYECFFFRDRKPSCHFSGSFLTDSTTNQSNFPIISLTRRNNKASVRIGVQLLR